MIFGNYHLFIHNAVFLIGGGINVILPLIVLFVNRKKINSPTITFLFMSWSVAVFQIFQVLGANAPTADLSRQFFMFNLTDIWIGAFMTHWFLAVIGKNKEHRERVILTGVYAFAAVLFTVCVLWPQLFLHDSVPKLYLPFYYNPGPLYGVMVAYFFITQIYYFGKLILAYRREKEPILKNRYRYVLIAMLYAYATGQLAFLLVFNIPVDPMWASFVGLYPLLLAYTMVRYQLMDVKLIIQRAFIYAAGTAILIGIISFSNYANEALQRFIFGFPSWVVPLVLSLLGVAAGVFVWNKFRQNDILKYEFVTIIAHKFRTPLTRIKWSAEELREMETDSTKLSIVENIERAGAELVSLTGTLIELSDVDKDVQALYVFKITPVCDFLKSVTDKYATQFSESKLILDVKCLDSQAKVNIDPEHMKFVLQTLLENAAAYTPEGGKVSVIAEATRKSVRVSVTDTGIGIEKSDLPLIFSKFYRTKDAKRTDTEGFGVGLYLSQSVALRHGGKIEVSSEGKDKGSTFTVVLPRI